MDPQKVRGKLFQEHISYNEGNDFLLSTIFGEELKVHSVVQKTKGKTWNSVTYVLGVLGNQNSSFNSNSCSPFFWMKDVYECAKKTII